MEQLYNGYTLDTPEGTFPLSTDSMLLSHFVKLKKNAAVLDLGSGCGTLGILLCAKEPGCTVTGIEIAQASHDAALENIRRNKLQARLFSICGDLRGIQQQFPAGSFHTCVSNPPYFTGGPLSETNPQARSTSQCTVRDLFQAASWALKWGGDFYLVHKPEALGELCGWAAKCQLEPKELTLVRHDSTKPVNLILLKCRKGAKPGLKWAEFCLHTPSGEPTQLYRKIYHL